MDDCIFCKIVRGEIKSWKVYEDEYAYALLDINPLTKYHTLVIPKKHFENIFDIPKDEYVNLMSAVKKIVDMYAEKLNIKNLQIFNNNGVEGQQDVFHLHYHIVPRSYGDGQDIKWTTHSEWRDEFDDMLKRLNG